MSAPVEAPDRWAEFRHSQREDYADSIIAAVSDPLADALSVTEIVKRTGTSRKTFYKYFDSLTAAVVYTEKSVLRRLSEHAAAAVPVAASGREHLLTVLEDNGRVATKSPELFRFISFFDYTYRYSGMDEANQQAFDSSMRVLYADAMDIFLAGQADGSIRSGLRPDVTVGAMSSAVIGLVQRQLAITSSAPDPQGLLDMIALEIAAWRAFLS